MEDIVNKENLSRHLFLIFLFNLTILISGSIYSMLSILPGSSEWNKITVFFFLSYIVSISGFLAVKLRDENVG